MEQLLRTHIVNNNMIEKLFILQEMDKIQYEQVVDDGYGQYGATETLCRRHGSHSCRRKNFAGDYITELCLDDVVYYLYQNGSGKTFNSALYKNYRKRKRG